MHYQEEQLPECKSLDEAHTTYQAFRSLSKEYDGKTWLLGCPVPCLQLQYRYSLSELHGNNWIETKDPKTKEHINKYFTILASYETMDIEKQEENLIYDSGSFFAAVGGNLGLFLGFSCFSVIIAGVDFIAKKI